MLIGPYLNPAARRDPAFRGFFEDDEYRAVRDFYTDRHDAQPTPLRSLSAVANALGIQAVDAKDESGRFGLNAFKIVGVRYAVHRLGPERTRNGLVCATAGNHGRAVARVARDHGVPCTVFVPALHTSNPLERQTRTARVSAMQMDGAHVIEVDGTYEEAVARSAGFGTDTGATVVSDTSWPGYEQIPRLIMAGYTQIFEEAAAQWEAPPEMVLVQGGVGGLVCAAANWFAWRFGAERPFLIACEPENAACLLESARAGHPVTITSSLDTIMAGLRCAKPSPAAWPSIAAGVDGFVAVPDALVEKAMAALASAAPGDPIVAGPSGACGVAALLQLIQDRSFAEVRMKTRLDGSSRALIVITEGA